MVAQQNTFPINDQHLRVISSSLSDLKQLQQLSRLTFTQTFGAQNTAKDLAQFLENAYAIDVLRKEIADPHSVEYFYMQDDQPVGYLKLNWDDAQTEDNFPQALEIQRIYLLQAVQGQHLGGVLMKQALAVADFLHKSQVWLGVWEHNLHAQGFYHHYGFKKVGAHTFTVGTDQQTDYLFLRDSTHH